MKDFKSEQERIIYYLSHRSLAAPFVFVPDKWKRKGKYESEPADLVWACNGYVFLLYMKSGKRDAGYLDGKNLGQADGWLALQRNSDP